MTKRVENLEGNQTDDGLDVNVELNSTCSRNYICHPWNVCVFQTNLLDMHVHFILVPV